MKRRRKSRKASEAAVEGENPSSTIHYDTLYDEASALALQGSPGEARKRFLTLERLAAKAPQKAILINDLAALSALEGDLPGAIKGFETALAMDPSCEPAELNLSLVRSRLTEESAAQEGLTNPLIAGYASSAGPVRVAILSFLFNWPSTGGGIIHTVELGQFLAHAGCEVQHFYAVHRPWNIGNVEGTIPFSSEALVFEEAEWNAAHIQERFRAAVDRFRPDHVIITDSWNFKPLLADAVKEYPYILRMQALECLCPLNNVRLLIESTGDVRQCGCHQLATPEECWRCLRLRGDASGGLHRAERALSGVGSPYYDRILRQAFRGAEAVFVVNPLTAEMVSPYSEAVRVSPAGMDPGRFPWPWSREPIELRRNGRMMVFFGGLVDEAMKGFHVLREACARLHARRDDFELVATGGPAGCVDGFTRFVGWLSQETLPKYLRAADICVIPTIAQEALGRTAVEAMAVGRPVVASRLGGLPFTVAEGATGLLCEAGNVHDLAQKLEMLLDDRDLRERMGIAGRRRFEEYYQWDVVIRRDYMPLFASRLARPGS